MDPPRVVTASSSGAGLPRLGGAGARPVVPAPERDVRGRVAPDLLQLLGGHLAHGLGRDPHHQPARRHHLAGRNNGARAHLSVLLDHRAGQDERADPDPRVVLDRAGVHHRPVADRHPVAHDAGKLRGDVEHRAVLDVRVPPEADVVVLVAAEHGAGPDARALLDRHVADHLRGGIDPRVGVDARLSSGHLADHRAVRPAAPETAAICARTARKSGVPGAPSSVTMEKWSWPAMSITSARPPRRRHAAASASVWRWYSSPSFSPRGRSRGPAAAGTWWT